MSKSIAFYLLVFSCLINFRAHASGGFKVLITEHNAEQRMFLQNVPVFIDTTKRFSIEALLRTSESAFRVLPLNESIPFPLVVFGRATLVNKTNQLESGYLGFCAEADSIYVFPLMNGLPTDTVFLSKSTPLQERFFPSNINLFPIWLSEAKSQTYAYAVFFSKEVLASHLNELTVASSKSIIKPFVERNTFQFLYAGAMFIFLMLGLFAYFLFKDKTFIYFAFLQLAFVYYFLNTSRVLGGIVSATNPEYFKIQNHISISLLILSVFLFAVNYVKLRSYLPKLFTAYVGFTLFVACFSHVFMLLTRQDFLGVRLNNLFILIWTIFSITLISIVAAKKDAMAQRLVVAFGILFVSGVIFILTLEKIIPSSVFTKNSFQIGTFLFSLLLFYNLFEKVNLIQQEKARIEKLDHIKSTFFANISHEFRTPLTLIMGPINQLLEKTNNARDEKLLKVALKNAHRLLAYVNQVLDLSKLESEKQHLQVQQQNITKLLKGATMSFESLARQQNIRLHFASQNPDLLLWFDADLMEKLILNLLSNAFKFTREGEVSVLLIEKEREVSICVRDSGCGILEDDLPHLFERFFQVKTHMASDVEGSGLGLPLVKEIVAQHQGRISVSSKLGKGSTFTIFLKKGSNHFSRFELNLAQTKANEKLSNAEQVYLPGPVMNENETKQNVTKKVPTLLLVEDNTDVREYMKMILGSDYNIIEAADGELGIEQALKYNPAIVISDVMMPKKNGFELCDFIKQDERTSHIPIILLTARASQEEKLEGLEFGADDYLTKPFDAKELEIRVRKLIELRAHLRKKILASPIQNFAAEEISQLDKHLLEKAFLIITENLGNSEFNVDVFAQAMSASNTQLNRKLKALTGLSTNKYIQHVRLQKALTMLENQEGNVSEVAYLTGFSSTPYFVKCFREAFGKTPGSLLRE